MSGKSKDLSRLVKEINLFGSTIPINYHTKELIADDGDMCLGLYRLGEHEIDILNNKAIPYDSQLRTLLHECLEAIVHNLELDVPHASISALETSLFMLLRENPQLCKAFSIYKPKGEK